MDVDKLLELYRGYTQKEDKKKAWKALLIQQLQKSCNTIDNATLGSDFVNALSNEFLSAINDACISCEEDPSKLLEYLSKGNGCLMLLALNLYAEQVTSCCKELCDVLLSFIPIFLQDNLSDIDSTLGILPPFKSDLSSFKYHLQSFSQGLIGLPNIDCHGESSDESIDKLDEQLLENNVRKWTEKLDCIHMERKELFYQTLSAFLGISLNDIMLRDTSVYVGFIEKLLEYLSGEYYHNQNNVLASYQSYSIVQVAVALLYELSLFKDGLAIINMRHIYADLHKVCLTFLNKPTVINVFQSLNSIRLICSCVYRVTCPGSSYNLAEASRILNIFHELQFFAVLKNAILFLDSKLKELDNDLLCIQNDIYIRYCVITIDLIIKLLTKICKQTYGLKGNCGDTFIKSTELSDRRSKVTRRYDFKRSEKISSSEEELAMSSDVKLNGMQHSDEEPAEDLSDFDFFCGSSEVESDMTGHVVKSKPDISNKKGSNNCFIFHTSKLLSHIFTNVQYNELQVIVLRALQHFKLCQCSDIDQFLVGILSRLQSCEESVVDKTLLFFSQTVSSHSDCLSPLKAGTSKRIQPVRTRISSSDCGTAGETGTDVVDGKKKSFQFITKLKGYLNATNVLLKVYILKHLKTMANKIPTLIQKDIFSRIILQNFCIMFPVNDLINIDSNFTFSESTSILKGYLEVTLTYMKLNDQLPLIFVQQEGIEIIRILSVHSKEEICELALRILEFLACLPSHSTPWQHKMSQINKITPESKLHNISQYAITVLVQVASKYFSKCQPVYEFDMMQNKGLLFVLSILENLCQDHLTLHEEFLTYQLDQNCSRLFNVLIEKTLTIQESNKIEVTLDHDEVETTSKNGALFLLLLDWIKILLSLELFLSMKRPDANEKIMEQLQGSILHPSILMGCHNIEVCLTVLQSATKCKRKLKSFFREQEGSVASEVKSPVSILSDDGKEQKKFILSQDEEGYDADQESDDDPTPAPFSRKLLLHQNSFKRTSISSGLVDLSFTQFPIITHPWLCVVILKYLSSKREEFPVFESLLNIVLAELHDYQLYSVKNNACLSQESLFKVLITEYGFVFTESYSKEIQELVGRMLILLSSHKISANDLKLYLQLFKNDDACMNVLSDVLLKMTKSAVEFVGPRYYFQFPFMFDEQYLDEREIKTNLHRAQTFMLHKHDHHNSYRSRNQSWSSFHEGNGSSLKPLTYSNQQPAFDSAVIKLPLESKFLWPDKAFSISIWYNLEDNVLHRYECDDNNIGQNYRKQHSISLLYQRSNETLCDYGCEELYHMCSFGGAHALFEIWIGSRTGSLQYRWIVSEQAGGVDEKMTVFDQIIIQNDSTLNKWHHLVVSLMLPSQPSTAEIHTFLDACPLPKTSMKYPRELLNSQTKLSLLLGHGYKNQRILATQEERTLKTGKQNVQHRQEPVVDHIKAVYLYSLGANSSNINTDYQKYFSSQIQSHMDSSLNWDSIVFKEFSFCMSILSQKLVSSNFPLELLYKPMDVLPTIKMELLNSLMLVYNPQSYKRFQQYIPRFKNSGQIQHIYITDTLSSVSNEESDGNTNQSVLYGDIQPRRTYSLQDAVHNCGGIAVLLFLHAMVAEQISSEVPQSAIIRAIFLIQDNCPFLLREMNDLAGYVLLTQSLKLSPTPVDIVVIKTLLQSICDGEIFVMAGNGREHLDIADKNTSAIVKNVCILQMVLKDWHLIRNTTINVQELFWSVLQALVRPDHPNVSFNIIQFNRARVVENLLMNCQDLQQESGTQLPVSLCDLYIGVITNLLGQPIDQPILRAVCSFLIAIHPTLDTLTLHSARNFYLIAKVQNPSGLSLPVCGSQSQRISKREISRRTASFSEADLSFCDSRCSVSPQVILSQEDLSSGSIIQSEVIIQRASITSVNSDVNNSSFTTTQADEMVHTNFPEASTPAKLEPQLAMASQKDVSFANPLVNKAKQRGHRRIQSDGAINFDSIDSGKLRVKLTLSSAESQDYEIISDSELPSSYEGHDEYLVVDGFIDQTVGSFTPQQVQEEFVSPKPDVLFHLRLGLMKLLKTTLTLLPDSLVTRVFGTILKIENLLALVNQPSDRVREIALENLMLYLQRGGRDCLANFNRFMGCHLLANQIHQHSITVKTIELCIGLLVSRPLKLSKEMLDNFECKDDDVTPMAIVPCITLLEGCVQKPTSFGLLVSFFISVFEKVESLPLIAFDHGLADIIGNIVYGLANEATGNMNTSWKKESFSYLLKLIDWLIVKACCTCQSLFFQMFKDLHLTLGNIDAREKEKTGVSQSLLNKTCHFLRYYLVQSALSIFKSSELYITQASFALKNDEPYLSLPGTDSSISPASLRRTSAAKHLINKIRGGAQAITPPTVATPSEIQVRFQEVLYEAVKLATIFNKSDHMTEFTMFGKPLRCLIRQQQEASNDGDREFCKDLLEWFFDSIQVALSVENYATSWSTLLKLTKDEVIQQAHRVTLHLVSPFRSNEIRFHFLKLIVKYRENKALVQCMLFANALSKNRDRFFACLQSILSISQTQLSNEEKLLFSDFKNAIPKSNFPKINDQKLLGEMRENFEQFHEKAGNSIDQVLVLDYWQLNLCNRSAGLYMRIVNVIYNAHVETRRAIAEHCRTIDCNKAVEILTLGLKLRKREEELLKQKEALKRVKERNADLCQRIANQGMEVSKVIVEEQDRQRQKLLRLVRGNNSKDMEVRKTWRNLIHHLTQERALWYNCESYPQSWQLDPTEGPFRMRKRLQRCHLDILPKFFLPDAPVTKCMNPKSQLPFLFQDNCNNEERPTFYSFKTNDTIRFLYHCKRVTPATKNTGEVLIGETHMYFVGDDILEDTNVTQAFFGERDVVSISWRYDEIQEILKRRYSLQNNALEIFLTSGRTFLLAFDNTMERDAVYEQLVSRELPNLITNATDLVTLTNRWKSGRITNFEYLMELNKKAGRSFNDLMQYPVFPFILAQYDEERLDLSDPTSFRNLMKPIACQDKEKEERYIEYYNYLKSDYEQLKLVDSENATPPYHYSSHYSNSGTVLHFLVRLPPFTSMFLKYQDNQFDIPDRTFHAMSTTWRLSSYTSNTDVKELIPEFFFLQEFLLNNEQFDMGVRQTKERVNSVILPKWCNGDPRLFCLIHMQALESQHVSANLHHWIDLVFGFKQSGPAAIKATNVFHPATYFGVDVNAIKDNIHRRALQTMIETYGQTPLQLFTSPHPKRFSKASPTFMDIIPATMESIKGPIVSKQDVALTDALSDFQSLSSPIDIVIGVQWGDYCGSPSHPAPVVSWVDTCLFVVKKIITSSDSLSAYLCHTNICIIAKKNINTVTKNYGMLTWNHSDMFLRVRSSYTNVKTTFNPMRPDGVTCCEYVSGTEILLVGGKSGVLNVWPVRFSLDGPSLDIVGAKQNLLGHSDVITSIKVCQAYSIAVTTSKDRTAIIWDLNRLCYIRSMPEHDSCIDCVTVNDATGDIATACNQDGKGIIYLWTVNAMLIGKITDVKVNCLAFSSLPDGIAVNVIAAGLDNGMIRMWDTWTLQPLRSLQANSTREPITALSFSLWDPLHFFSSDKSGNVYLWTNKNVTIEKPPVYVQVIPNR